jgi:hypothetical protein
MAGDAPDPGTRQSLLELEPTDSKVAVRGLAELVPDGGAWIPRRLPLAAVPLLAPSLETRAQMPASGRIQFVTDARRTEVDVAFEAAEGAQTMPFDVVVDGEIASRTTIGERGTLVVENPSRVRQNIDVWMPQFGFVRLGRLRFYDCTKVSAPRDDAPRWTAYGSSITQCRTSAGPAETWPALVARRQGWNLRGLGFGSECHLDPIVGRFIRDTPAELISLCLGINIYGGATFNERSLGAAIAGFIWAIRDGHPQTPIVVESPIVSPSRESTPNAVGLTLAQVRGIVHETGEALIRMGDAGLHVIDGLEVIGWQDQTLLLDGLHPRDAGYRLMADRLGPRLSRVLSDSQLEHWQPTLAAAPTAQ